MKAIDDEHNRMLKYNVWTAVKKSAESFENYWNDMGYEKEIQWDLSGACHWALVSAD